MLARSLKLSDGDIAQIEYAHDRNLRECVYNMLSLWNGQRSRTEATKEAVYQALVEVDMVNAAGETQIIMWWDDTSCEIILYVRYIGNMVEVDMVNATGETQIIMWWDDICGMWDYIICEVHR